MVRILNEHDFESTIDVPPEGVRYAGEDESGHIEKAEQGDMRIEKIIIPESCISKRVDALALEISRDYGNTGSLDVVVVLTGAIMFASDLCRALYKLGRIETNIHPVKTVCYGDSVKGDGEEHRNVQIVLSADDLYQKDILIIEDLIDQGFTLQSLVNYLLNEEGANSVKICTMLNKKLNNPTLAVQKIRDELRVNYQGFLIPDLWVSGYGINTAGSFRNMPFIITVNLEYYK